MHLSENTIWTIGHSTKTLDEFLEMLQAFSITQVADVRRFPGSRKYPQYNKEILEQELSKAHIGYVHLESLGGRRKAKPDSRHTAWRHPAFRGYADYMETSDFKKGILLLEQLARQQRTAYMCSEAVWWRCHRSMISDFLKNEGWMVQHIMAPGKATGHPFTAPAKIINGELTY